MKKVSLATIKEKTLPELQKAIAQARQDYYEFKINVKSDPKKAMTGYHLRRSIAQMKTLLTKKLLIEKIQK